MLDLTLVVLVAIFMVVTLIQIIKKNNELLMPLWAALFFRICALIIDKNLISLPDSAQDALYFESYAWEIANNLNHFGDVIEPNYGTGWLFSWFVANIYYAFGRNQLLIQWISIFIGLLVVCNIYRITNLIWDSKAATTAAWITASFPTLILYSILVLREIYIIFLLSYAVLNLLLWIDKRSNMNFLKALIAFYLCGFLHSAMIITIIISILLYFFSFLKHLVNLKINIIEFFLLILFIFILFQLIELNFSYIGTMKEIFIVENWIEKGRQQATGFASFPEWLTPSNTFDYIFLLPVRIIYFLGSPFVWDISSSIHFIGLIDGTLYLIITLVCITKIKYLIADSKTRVLLIIGVTLIIVHAVGTGNFGTGIRHRSKFLVLSIILTAPFLYSFFIQLKRQFLNFFYQRK